MAAIFRCFYLIYGRALRLANLEARFVFQMAGEQCKLLIQRVTCQCNSSNAAEMLPEKQSPRNINTDT